MIVISIIILIAFFKTSHYILFKRNPYLLYEKICYLFLLTLAPIAALKLINDDIEQLINTHSVCWNLYICSLALVFVYVFAKKARKFDEIKRKEIYKSLIITLIGLIVMYITRN